MWVEAARSANQSGAPRRATGLPPGSGLSHRDGDGVGPRPGRCARRAPARRPPRPRPDASGVPSSPGASDRPSSPATGLRPDPGATPSVTPPEAGGDVALHWQGLSVGGGRRRDRGERGGVGPALRARAGRVGPKSGGSKGRAGE